MRHPARKFLSLIVCLMFVNVMVLCAQNVAEPTSSVAADPTGAVVSGVTVAAHNIGNRTQLPTTCNS